MKPNGPALLTPPKPSRAVSRYNRQATICPASGKRSYRTKRKALRVAEKTKAQNNENIFVYRCPRCSLFHLTHYSQRAAA